MAYACARQPEYISSGYIIIFFYVYFESSWTLRHGSGPGYLRNLLYVVTQRNLSETEPNLTGHLNVHKLNTFFAIYAFFVGHVTCGNCFFEHKENLKWVTEMKSYEYQMQCL